MGVIGVKRLYVFNKPRKTISKRCSKPDARFPKLSVINSFSPPDRGKISVMELPPA